MEVLMHEMSNGQETNAVDTKVYTMPKQTEKKVENAHVEDGTCFMESNAVDTVDIMFENIKYTVSLGCKKGQKEILHGINGRLPAKHLIALMGPSGAGKSTLLDILSGFRTTGMDGNIYINGHVRHLNSFRKCSTYITQDDRLEALLTVAENMTVAADLKLPTSTPRYEKETIIKDILNTLGLYEHMNTLTEKLSGGQRKRLSIALELVNNPTVMFLDEPTTGLDSSSCMHVVNLLKLLARQGRTIVCTIHQPSASLFQLFDLVYVLANGECLFHGATTQLVSYLENVKLPCPVYYNPADYVIELACGEYGDDKIAMLISGSKNGKSTQWFQNADSLVTANNLRALHPIKKHVNLNGKSSLHATSLIHQIKILIERGFIKSKRDTTLTYLRIIVNIAVGLMLGMVFVGAGTDGARVLDNYNLLFSILIHHLMTTMMLTVVTFPMQMSILLKEHFNRWYSLKAFYTAITVIELPISIICCLLFTVITYLFTCQPLEMSRFFMFFAISLLVVLISQGAGLMIGAVCNVINGTFVGPTLTVPLMMFAGFGVTLRDIPNYLKWGTYISFLRYGLEGYIGAIYGFDRPVLFCESNENLYCHYRYPAKFLSDIAMEGNQFWNDIVALIIILILTRCAAYFLLKWKIMSVR
ncbi:ATP-binding cassette subfamily G member 4 isoform X1 [Bombus vancouverensis nearcticus]|uniref:ATP-binding cassette sub-family G member 4-like isoform X1 n=2 Tax=Bombus bifarius TaxID=103933 RepID=A0A6P8MWA9_9HYME|nr:ATP-binding cassette sub-family G member 4-like isoform X1 [Bombus vancouverensis nearcticus]XP_033306485.1 ATP-binding cassette sub-family G member 4-like isoform X1 [Bombus bifarius]